MAGVGIHVDTPRTDRELEQLGRVGRPRDRWRASFDAHNARNLRQAAGNAVAYGLPYDAAIRAITAAPAALWGIADRYGTLAPGMDADLLVWSGDPFEPLTALEAYRPRR